MHKIEFRCLIDSVYLSLIDLTTTKGEEYSRDADQLANFKRQAEELCMTPEKVLMVYLNKHLDAIKSFVKTGKIHSEPIQGRIQDAILYLILLQAIVEEQQNQSSCAKNQPIDLGTWPITPLDQATERILQNEEKNHPQFELK